MCSPGLMKAATLFREQNKLKQEKSPEYAAIYLVNKLIHNDEMGRNMQQCTDKLHLSRPFPPGFSPQVFRPDQCECKICLDTQASSIAH